MLLPFSSPLIALFRTVVMADDPDAGSNGEVRYSLAAEGESDAADVTSLFAVEPHTGWVTTLAALDREARPEHRLALLAADGGSPRRVARGTLVVRLVDYNDCPPAFERAEYAAEVREDAPPGTVAVRLAVTDADAGGAPLSFFVAAGDERARFQLRASGELYVARPLDRETRPTYELSVAATDGKFTAYTRVRVAVLDVNGERQDRSEGSVSVCGRLAPVTSLLSLCRQPAVLRASPVPHAAARGRAAGPARGDAGDARRGRAGERTSAVLPHGR